MKQTPEYDAIQHQMEPGIITLDGFLGTDKRHLVDILASDDVKVHQLKVTHQAIASRMQYFRDAGLDGLGQFITVDGHFEVCVDSVRGKLPSPFGGPGMYEKVNTTVRNLSLEREITYTDLHIHFVGDHGFYEGAGSPFRIEPADLVAVLEVKGDDD
ncbi:MAG: hypothetical protein PQJ47_09695 [Sphaerochaetaceae bacterium]|nr:hypothetical protein [Sphaerochaetaceae bacterium]MDC7247782.1 hypothetical protein [Sphaerochaetaceae bacterium]